ncbi:uncharacterized protein LOC127156720 [Labeo rohita]|uniref:uncharacterized protein LOC127156720 n=1 Tax=Labeo rohita TaxID=84645 RepID=UPI0021E32430|nr:uncharacterized protein LOC127156720 [Labeo rohita]
MTYKELSIRRLYDRHVRRTPVPYRTVRIVAKRPSVCWPEEHDYRRIYYGGDHGLIHHSEKLQEHRERLLKQQEALYSYNTQEDRPAGPQADLRVGGAVSSQSGVRGQRSGRLRPASSGGGKDTLLQAIANLNKMVDGKDVRRGTLMPFVRQRLPESTYAPSRVCKQKQNSSGGSLSDARNCTKQSDKHRPSSDLSGRSAHASASASKIFFSDLDEIPGLGGEPGEPTLEERHAQAIKNKVLEIEKLYKQDCETVGIVVRMLISKDPTLGPTLLSALHKNLVEIGDKYLENLSRFISEVSALVKPNQTKPAKPN